MLRVTGRLADGTALWLAGPKWIEEVVIPEMGGAAREAGRPEPRVIAGVPIAVTVDPDGTRERISKAFAMYNTLPSYQRVIQGSGADDPAGRLNRRQRGGGRAGTAALAGDRRD